MATPIPCIAAEIQVDGDIDGIAVTGGAGGAQTLAATRRYYFVSNVSTAAAGESFLMAVQAALEASSANTWTVKLSAPTSPPSSGLRVTLAHTSSSSKTVTFDTLLATNLGFTSASFAVANGVTVTATNRPRWLWSPDMPISATGPRLFDVAKTYGIPTSVGTSQRAPDMVSNYVNNGIQREAEYIFRGVEGAWKIDPDTAYVNEDLVGFWDNAFRKGRRCLWWRDRDNATGSAYPSAGASSPYRYIIYAPGEALRAAPLVEPVAEPNLNYWDVRFPLWVTDSGESTL